MAARRKRNGADEVELLMILAAVAGIGYVLYKAVPKGVADLAKGVSNAAGAAAGSVADYLAPTPQPSANTSYEIPGTGQTVSDLVARGWTNDEINQLLADAIAKYGMPAIAAPAIIPVGPSVGPGQYVLSNIAAWLTGS
jgi:hypothetical protein